MFTSFWGWLSRLFSAPNTYALPVQPKQPAPPPAPPLAVPGSGTVPPGAKRLLAFIAGYEAAGNYNAYYGHAKSTIPLTGWTIAAVQQFQTDILRNGSASSAVGAFQFIKGTLARVCNDLHLGGSVIFSKDTQDLLAFQLLKGRGWNRYLNGFISATEFGNEIAKEWASMPCLSGPKAGRSYYAGDGLNKSLVDTKPFLAAVVDAKK